MLTAKKKTTPAIIPWIQAARPKTLTASIVPFLAGTALASAEGFSIHWNLLIFALLSALCIQISTNLINDAFDYAKGTDSHGRLGPLRAIHQGVASLRQVYFLGLTFFALAFLFAIPLITYGGSIIAIILFASMLAGYLYTAGPFPLAYKGLGDLFVLLFFGWVATLAAYWLQSGSLDGKSFLLGTQIGLLCTVLIILNNFRDAASDLKSGKQTLAVRFGPTFTRIEMNLCILLPFALNGLWFSWGYYAAGALPYITLPLGLFLIRAVKKHPPSPLYNQFLALSALLHLSFGLFLAVGLMMHSSHF